MLNPEKIESYRKKLEAEKASLLLELKKIERVEDFGSDVDDFSEEQEEAESKANELAVAQTLKNRINEIDSALNKIAAGKFGICEKCGSEIETKELDIIPETHLCARCKKA